MQPTAHARLMSNSRPTNAVVMVMVKLSKDGSPYHLSVPATASITESMVNVKAQNALVTS
jgi:hypothetical protein